MHQEKNNYILIVEDNEVIITVVTKILESHGYSVISALNGKIGLDMIESDKWDIALIISDIEMPEMDGIELFWALKSLYPDLIERTIFMTGHSAKADIQSFLEENNCICIRKPIKMDILLSTIKSALK